MRRIDPATIKFDLQDAVAKVMRVQRVSQRDIATAIGRREATISEFMNREVETTPEVIELILAELGTSRAEMDQLVARMNGLVQGPPRTPNTRADDRDPVRKKAAELAHDIGDLPKDARNAVVHLLLVLKDAYRGPRS